MLFENLHLKTSFKTICSNPSTSTFKRQFLFFLQFKLSNIDFDTNGDVSASPLYRDYEMVTPTSAPDATFTLNGETYSIQDAISNPNMFLNKEIIFQRMEGYYPEKVTIGTIEDDAIGFPVKGYKGSDVSFSLTPITDGEESGKIEVGGKTIYYTMYNV